MNTLTLRHQAPEYTCWIVQMKIQEKDMKLPDNVFKKDSSHYSVGINTFTLLGISLVWGHMLSLISLWFLPLTVLAIMVGYGTEVQERKGRQTLSL